MTKTNIFGLKRLGQIIKHLTAKRQRTIINEWSQNWAKHDPKTHQTLVKNVIEKRHRFLIEFWCQNGSTWSQNGALLEPCRTILAPKRGEEAIIKEVFWNNAPKRRPETPIKSPNEPPRLPKWPPKAQNGPKRDLKGTLGSQLHRKQWEKLQFLTLLAKSFKTNVCLERNVSFRAS